MTEALRHPVIVFDFDGTLVESNPIKSGGFAHVFADRPQCAAAVADVLQRSKGVSRHEIIAALADMMTDLASTERRIEAERRTERYTAWVEERIVEKAALSPAGELLQQWRRHASLYVCSLTPLQYLQQILERLGWHRHLAGIEGYPVDKQEMLRRTAARHAVRPEQTLMVGDSSDDESAAAAAGTAFFRIRNMRDLLDLDRYLKA